MSRWNLVRWVGRSGGLPLWTLFVCVATVLVMGMQWAVVARMVPQAEESVRDGIDEALLTAHDVWTRRASEHAENQASRVATIVKDQGFIETINPSVDVPGGVFGPEYRPTLLSALANLNSRAAYDAAFVLDHEGRALLQEPASLVVPPEVLTRMMAGLRARGAAPRRGKSVPVGHGLAVLGERGYRMVLLDLGTLDAQRWLLVGFRLQPELEALHTDTRVRRRCRLRVAWWNQPSPLRQSVQRWLRRRHRRRSSSGQTTCGESAPTACRRWTAAPFRCGWPGRSMRPWPRGPRCAEIFGPPAPGPWWALRCCCGRCHGTM